MILMLRRYTNRLEKETKIMINVKFTLPSSKHVISSTIEVISQRLPSPVDTINSTRIIKTNILI